MQCRLEVKYGTHIHRVRGAWRGVVGRFPRAPSLRGSTKVMKFVCNYDGNALVLVIGSAVEELIRMAKAVA